MVMITIILQGQFSWAIVTMHLFSLQEKTEITSLNQRDVTNVECDNILEIMDPNEIARKFTTRFNSVMDRHAPTKCLKIREHAPDWLNTDYLAHIDEREYWGKQFDKSPTEFNLTMKMQSIERNKQLKLDLHRSYFNDELLRCGNDAKKK